jgi:hypothetical protein
MYTWLYVSYPPNARMRRHGNHESESLTKTRDNIGHHIVAFEQQSSFKVKLFFSRNNFN